jgi:site-specific DNA-methyltransferase (adenine-specific)
MWVLIHNDCIEAMKVMPENSVDAIVTDPPYGLSFMGKKWDYNVPSAEVWREALRVLKPGGHALIACGTRTQHRMTVNIEDAGFEIRDVVVWMHGQGFPKSLDISKAIDKANGDARQVVGHRDYTSPDIRGNAYNDTKVAGRERLSVPITSAASAASAAWEGWGTALKPACEFWTLARKPLSEGTVAKNVLKWGTGGINVDGCRVNPGEAVPGGGKSKRGNGYNYSEGEAPANAQPHMHGRFPANLVLSHAPECEESPYVYPDGSTESQCSLWCPVRQLDEQSGTLKAGVAVRSRSGGKNFGSDAVKPPLEDMGYPGGGGASRFYYCAKVSPSERNAGLEDAPDRVLAISGGAAAAAAAARGESYDNGDSSFNKTKVVKNNHPTLKPLKLMRYLCRLVTPPGGLVLDPFTGSGSTGVAAIQEGFRFVGIEKDEDYAFIAKLRLKHADELQKALGS